ncbi:S41 family peptidase [Limibaculum sp. M0105]|uniref:S41 family peptidase n=1 Tax=Thermohalobaculum xanthum TaxID=2753746 RepID=A0A8J7MAL4_9RHOB|nr:S41 family peptidase [Thermohalobaculum xanthum]MBK0400672.1 S41 family peptidase [Thermohalobaculum xanthum]
MRKTLLALAAGVALGISVPHYVSLTHAQENSARTTYEYLDLFGDIFQRVRSSYVEDVDEKKLVEAAINGMLASLDPHSTYLPPANFEDMREQTRGEFGGLGIEVTMENGFVKVVAPIDETPAARAGIEAGDFITHIDGESVLGLTLSDAVDKMRGPVGSEITITIGREGAEEPFDVTIVRDTIRIRAVRARAEGDIGVIRITTFNEQTSDNLRESIAELQEEIGADKITGYVIDLRNNPGGLLTQAIEVSDAFLDEGEIVSTRGRDLDQAERVNAQPGDVTGGKPIVVLINEGSASASEIVAGALQDQRRAIIVGAKSFGKGSVQTIMRLGDKGAVKLTTARYYTPSGRSIQALGIEPDILVEERKIAADEQSSRPLRSEAELRGSLSNELSEDERKLLEEERSRHEATAKLRADDFQLAYAIDLLNGLAIYEGGRN